MVGGGVVLLTGRLVWLGKWARGVAAEGGRRATVVALAVAAAGVAPVKNAGNQSGEGMPSGPRKRRVPRAVRGWGGQEGGDTLRGGNTIKIHPIFPSGCEGKLGVALESLQGLRDLT